ncbi:MAG: PilZ domain-containing protein [Gammaproteobacteria bacterium]|nr:PilZ domain-containing protein [Gammaproteobacteria bacterium]
MPLTHDKRACSRIRVNFPVSIELSNQKTAKGTAINIGQGGMLLDHVSGATFSKLDDVNLYLPINHSKNSFAIAAKITRIEGSQIGLFFYSDPSEYLLEAID